MFKQSFIAIIIVIGSLADSAQPPSLPLLEKLKRITAVPFWYTPLELDDPQWKAYQFNKPLPFKDVDTNYVVIVQKGKSILPKLTQYLSDTTLSLIPNQCDSGNFTIGQLAFFLINDIEYMPVRLVTKKQWDGMGNCLIILPDGWLDYLRTNGREFEELYRKYLSSKQRQHFVKGTLKSPTHL